MMKVKLTSAQIGALQCRDGGGWDEGSVVLAAWERGDRRRLEFDAEQFNPMIDELIDLCNAEDAHDIELRRSCGDAVARGARGAAVALTNLTNKVIDAKMGLRGGL